MKITVISYGEPIGDDAFRMTSKPSKWRKKPGHLYQRGGGKSNSHAKSKHYTKILVAQAMAMGYLNGVRIRKGR